MDFLWINFKMRFLVRVLDYFTYDVNILFLVFANRIVVQRFTVDNCGKSIDRDKIRNRFYRVIVNVAS